MQTKFESWKQQIESPDFNILDIKPVIPQDGMILHYTPRCKLSFKNYEFFPFRASYCPFYMRNFLFWNVDSLSSFQQPLQKNDELLDKV
jgi:hypothetical protein